MPESLPAPSGSTAYVVTATVGEYSSQRWWVLRVFEDGGKAALFARDVAAQTAECMAAYEKAVEAAYDGGHWPAPKDYVPALDPNMDPEVIEFYSDGYGSVKHTMAPVPVTRS